MCGFDDDWCCPNYTREDGRPVMCPPGGCRYCAKEAADDLARLTGSAISMDDVHLG